jgi:hypothetical protein
MSLMLFDTLQAEQISLRSFVCNLGDSRFIVRTCEKQVCTLRVSPSKTLRVCLAARFALTQSLWVRETVRSSAKAHSSRWALTAKPSCSAAVSPGGKPSSELLAVSPTRAEVSTPVALLRDCPSLVFVYLNVGLTFKLSQAAKALALHTWCYYLWDLFRCLLIFNCIFLNIYICICAFARTCQLTVALSRNRLAFIPWLSSEGFSTYLL